MKETHEFVTTLPLDERRRLGDQMQRASRSVPANIAEGYARRSSEREFKRYVTIAMGSANEMEVHFKIARDLGLGESSRCHRLIDEYQIVGKQLRMLSHRWRNFGTSSLQPPASRGRE